MCGRGREREEGKERKTESACVFVCECVFLSERETVKVRESVDECVCLSERETGRVRECGWERKRE